MPLDYFLKKNPSDCDLLDQRLKTLQLYVCVCVFFFFYNLFPQKDITMAVYEYVSFVEISGTSDISNLNNLVNVKW